LVVVKSQILRTRTRARARAHTHTHPRGFFFHYNQHMTVYNCIKTKGAQYAGSEIGGDVAEYKRHTALVIIVVKKKRKVMWVRMCWTANYCIYAVRLGTHPRFSRPFRA